MDETEKKVEETVETAEATQELGQAEAVAEDGVAAVDEVVAEEVVEKKEEDEGDVL